MSIDATNERRFEEDIESAMLLGGYIKGNDTYDAQAGLYVETLINFIRKNVCSQTFE